jgi:hypothetical protein
MRLAAAALTLSLVLLAAPLAAEAQQGNRVASIGELVVESFASADISSGHARVGLRRGSQHHLREPELDSPDEELPDVAAKLVRLRVDVILVVSSTPSHSASDDRILKGAKPSDLPFEQSAKFEFRYSCERIK